MQGSEGKLNVVLFHKAARVQALDIPKGAEISADLYVETEDGLEIDYSVWEEVPQNRHLPPRTAIRLMHASPKTITDEYRRSG